MIIRMDIKPLLGHYKLQQLDRLTYEREYIAKLEGRNSPSTVRLRHSIFKIAINAAGENELIARNRFTKVKITEPDKYNNENINFLSPEQLVTFLEDAKKHENITNYSLLLTVAYSGIRRGETLGYGKISTLRIIQLLLSVREMIKEYAHLKQIIVIEPF